MKILLLAQHFAPEEISGAVLATELATDLVEKGHEVTFVTCAPNYPQGEVFPGYQNKLYSTEDINGVKVIRVWSYISPSKSFWPRILNFGTFSLMALLGGLFAEKPDVIFSYSPPLPLGLSAWVLSRLKGVPWVLRVEDLFPDAAVSAGILKNNLVIRFFYAVEKFLYRKATHISLISEGFKNILLNKGVQEEKISVTPVWADEKIFQNGSDPIPFRKENALQDKFIVLYSGNIGQTSNLEDVLDAASILSTRTDIHFLIVGEGLKKESLVNRAHQDRLKNITFLPFQPRHGFADMLAAADVGLVTLNEKSSSFSLPSKIFNIMASGCPVLGITPANSEIAGLIQTHQCGINIEPGDISRLAEVIVELTESPGLTEGYSQKARLAVKEFYSREVCTSQFNQLLEGMR